MEVGELEPAGGEGDDLLEGRGGDDTLQGGTALARLSMGRILAIRVGLVIRGSAPEREDVSPSTITLFDDLGSTLQSTRTLTSAEQKYRWRTIEFTVPLRNVMLSPRS